MGRKKIIFGSAGSLRAVLEWRGDYGSDGPVGRTWGDLQLWVGDTLVWGELDSSGKTEGIAWSWIDFLEFLGNAWPYLIEEEQHPIAFQSRREEPAHLGELWGRSKIRWRRLPEEQADMEDGLLRNFFAVHDFAEAIQGAHPPQLLFLRQGNQILVATVRQEWVLSFIDTANTLESIGEAINNRLLGLTDTRSVKARSLWENHNTIQFEKRLQIATGRDEESLRRIWPKNVASDAANDELYEIKAAARMIGRKVSDEQLKAILEQISNLPNGRHLSLDTLQEKSVNIVREDEGQDPTTQGYLLAAMLREYLSCKTGKVDPQEILKSWGVDIRDINDADLPLDAIAVWGARHAPTILLNIGGPRAHHPTGKRSTLAHEICHLLVDTDGALPVAEVLGGNVPHAIEQRANAFAAEFLLPRAVAGAHIEDGLRFVNSPRERIKAMNTAIGTLVDNYGASHETTAWQILNSGSIDFSNTHLSQHLRQHLKSVNNPFDTDASSL